VVRLLDVDTDLLISLNVPVKSVENRINLDLNSTPDPGPVQSPEGSGGKDLVSSCIGRGCAYLLEALKGSSIVISISTSTSQPSIGDMLCIEVSKYFSFVRDKY
jgi:hypothetical protein